MRGNGQARFPIVTGACVALAVHLAAGEALVSTWSLEAGLDGDQVRGFYELVPGVSGKGLRLDGQTSRSADGWGD